ncbi:MAG: cell division protein SepF [Ruminococcaceae bacterium]|nr:cell division protein SepF [Oscillospiraceae bacterium]
MGLMDRIKKVTGTNDNYDDTYEDDYYNNFDNYDGIEDDGDVQMAGGMNTNVGMGGMDMGGAPMNNGGISLSGQNIRMKIVRPKSFADGSQIGRFLLNKCTVFLNLENTNRETARRLIDFLSGVAFSIDGTIKKVANNAYVITPSNVDVGEPAAENAKQRREEAEEAAANNASSDFEDFD